MSAKKYCGSAGGCCSPETLVGLYEVNIDPTIVNSGGTVSVNFFDLTTFTTVIYEDAAHIEQDGVDALAMNRVGYYSIEVSFRLIHSGATDVVLRAASVGTTERYNAFRHTGNATAGQDQHHHKFLLGCQTVGDLFRPELVALAAVNVNGTQNAEVWVYYHGQLPHSDGGGGGS